MARGINKVILIGNLGRDPETRYTQGGGPVTNFSVATSENWRDKGSGEQQERTEWHNVVCFGRLAEIAGEYLKKGSKVFIEGSLRTSNWEKDGQKHYRTEIMARDLQMLDSRGGPVVRRRVSRAIRWVATTWTTAPEVASEAIPAAARPPRFRMTVISTTISLSEQSSLVSNSKRTRDRAGIESDNQPDQGEAQNQPVDDVGHHPGALDQRHESGDTQIGAERRQCKTDRELAPGHGVCRRQQVCTQQQCGAADGGNCEQKRKSGRRRAAEPQPQRCGDRDARAGSTRHQGQ